MFLGASLAVIRHAVVRLDRYPTAEAPAALDRRIRRGRRRLTDARTLAWSLPGPGRSLCRAAPSTVAAGRRRLLYLAFVLREVVDLRRMRFARYDDNELASRGRLGELTTRATTRCRYAASSRARCVRRESKSVASRREC